jgi:hypothetical protein
VTTWLNTPIQMQFRVIDGLTVRFARSEDRDRHALLLSPWPEACWRSSRCGRGSPSGGSTEDNANIA